MTKRERRPAIEAARRIAEDEDAYCCHAIDELMYELTLSQWMRLHWKFNYFCRPRGYTSDWFSDMPEDSDRQLARSLALLLFAELDESEMP